LVSVRMTLAPQFCASVRGMTSSATPAPRKSDTSHRPLAPLRTLPTRAPRRPSNPSRPLSIPGWRPSAPGRFPSLPCLTHGLVRPLLHARHAGGAVRQARGHRHLHRAAARHQPRVQADVARHAHGVREVALHLSRVAAGRARQSLCVGARTCVAPALLARAASQQASSLLRQPRAGTDHSEERTRCGVPQRLCWRAGSALAHRPWSVPRGSPR
jgi:hypothetical protein